jgi:hypothetical protein
VTDDLLKNTMLAGVSDTLLGDRLTAILEAATDSEIEARAVSKREVQYRVRPRPKPNQNAGIRYFLVTIKEQM